MNCTQCGKLLPEANSPFCPFCGGTQSGDTANPTTEQANTEQPAPMQTVAEQLEAAQSEQPAAPMGGFQPAAAGSGTPFDPTLPQQPEKKRMPAWAIALIAGGIALVLAICCCLAMVGLFADEFMEGFEEGFNAALEETATNLDPIDTDLIAANDTNGNDNGNDANDAPADPPAADTESSALIQSFINDNRTDLLEMSEPLLATMGSGATVDFAAADGEFIYIYTYGDFPSEGLVEILEFVLDASESLYEMLADEFAREIGLDSLTLTVRYYDENGNFLIAESFESR